MSLYQQFFFFRPLPIQAWHLHKCMLPLLRTSQNTVEPRAYRCEKSPACRIYSLVLKTECVITTDQWSCFNGCKSRNPPQDHHRASSPLKADVQIDMHDNAMSVAAATAKIGSHASSNGLPYKDGVPSKNPVLKFFGDAELGIARSRLTRTGRIQSYEWSKLQPAYDKLGQVFEEHPIILLEPRRIANMDEVRPQLSPPMIVTLPGNPNLHNDYTGI